MITVSVIYPSTPGTHFNADYYLKSHMPLAARLLAPATKFLTVELGISGMPAPEAPYAAIARFVCDSVEDFQKTFAPIADELLSDIPNYTDISPVIQISNLTEIPIPKG